MNNSMKIGLVKATLLSILIALSGMAAIASADYLTANVFYGNVTLNGADASPETVINAYIEEEFRGSSENKVGSYYIGVMGNESDEGKVINFTVCGATADQTAVWYASYLYQPGRVLNLTAVDNVAPAVENANANPASVVNGTGTTQLNVTVIDGCRCTVGNVTVNLSAIGGDAAQEMERIGDTDVYSVTVTAAKGTAGAHYLYVNASDVFGECNTSVCIELEIETTPTYAKGDLDHNGDVADAVDVAMMLQASVGDITATSEYDLDGNDQNADAVDVAMMLQASVGDITL